MEKRLIVRFHGTSPLESGTRLLNTNWIVPLRFSTHSYVDDSLLRHSWLLHRTLIGSDRLELLGLRRLRCLPLFQTSASFVCIGCNVRRKWTRSQASAA